MPAQTKTASVDRSVLGRVDWSSLDEQVASEQRNREVHTPAISLFRWWARRSHALVGSLLDAAVLDRTHNRSFRVADPLSGGGTVAIEAARRGVAVYAQDLNPWAISGLRAALDGVDHEELEAKAEQLLESLKPLREELYSANCSRHGDSEVLAAFWVRSKDCPGCGHPVFLYPYPMITRDSRAKGEQRAWWGCSACGAVTRCSDATKEPRCGGCDRKFRNADSSLLSDRHAQCRHRGCGASFEIFDGGPCAEHLVLVQRRCERDGETIVHFDRPCTDDYPDQATENPSVPAALRESIPPGLETDILLRSGHSTWADLFTARQLRVLTGVTVAIDKLEASEAIKHRLRLAVSGSGEMAGHLCRWDRFYPKAFEAMANHRFSVTGLSCEVNLLAERGRGTLPRRFAASVRAARWASENLDASSAARWRARETRRSAFSGTLLSTGSSERQLPADGCVDLVLTDPPYFNSVQYAELSSLFLACARATRLLPDTLELDVMSEAVPNPRRGTGLESYREQLTAIFAESRRTLRSGGRLVLTFHSSDLRAWWALGKALDENRFRITALAAANSENAADHAKRAPGAFTKDLVLECRQQDSGDAGQPTVAWAPDDDQSAELIAAGRAVEAVGGDTFPEFRRRFLAFRGNLQQLRIHA